MFACLERAWSPRMVPGGAAAVLVLWPLIVLLDEDLVMDEETRERWVMQGLLLEYRKLSRAEIDRRLHELREAYETTSSTKRKWLLLEAHALLTVRDLPR